MPTVTCGKTGLVFQAASSRQKNHPQISQILTDANRNGYYNQALRAIKDGREQGFTTIEQFKFLIAEYRSGQTRIESERREAAAKAEAERKAAKERREAQNVYLRQYGYTWSKYVAMGPLDDELDGEWVLYSPDGRIVPVAQALDEIERGAEVVLAEKQIAADKIAAEKAALEALEAEKGRQAQAFHRTWKEAQSWPEVAPFEAPGKGKKEIARLEWGVYGERADQVFQTPINGVECFITRRAGGYDADPDITRYFSTDPQAAGLKPVKPEYGPAQTR